jgi:hypothetical protein
MRSGAIEISSFATLAQVEYVLPRFTVDRDQSVHDLSPPKKNVIGSRVIAVLLRSQIMTSIV